MLDHDRLRGAVLGGYGEWSMDVEWLLEEAARTAARRDWRRMGAAGEHVAYSLIVASYRRRMGVIAVREMVCGRVLLFCVCFCACARGVSGPVRALCPVRG